MIDGDSQFCPFCGLSTQIQTESINQPVPSTYMPPPWSFGPVKVSIGEVLSKSWKVISNRPIIIIPHLLSGLIGIIMGLIIGSFMEELVIIIFGAGNESLGEYFSKMGVGVVILVIIAFIIVFVIESFVKGLYPQLTKQILNQEEINLRETASRTTSRIRPLLGVALIAFLIEALYNFGINLAVAPEAVDFPELLLIGIIPMVIALYLWSWYYCAIPALMLGEKTAGEALSTSKQFSKGKKWSIIGIIFFVALFNSILTLVALLFSETVGTILLFIISLFFVVYNSVLPSYLYIRYSEGIEHAASQTHTPIIVIPPPQPTTRSEVQACPACGEQVDQNKGYCGWCGSKLS